MAEENKSDYPQFRDYPEAEMKDKPGWDIVFAFIAVALGAVIDFIAYFWFMNLSTNDGLATQKAVLCCIAIVAGSALICGALAMVFSRTATNRKMRFNWCKDQLDDYLARSGRRTDSARVK